MLYGPGHHRLDVKGCFEGYLTSKEKATKQQVYVVDELTKPLLGLPAIMALKLVKRVHTVDAMEPDAVPYALSSPRRVHLPLIR